MLKRKISDKNTQESCAIAKMTARCALYRMSRCGDMAIRNYPRWRRQQSWRFVRTGHSAIRSAVPENPTLEANMKWIGHMTWRQQWCHLHS